MKVLNNTHIKVYIEKYIKQVHKHANLVCYQSLLIILSAPLTSVISTWLATILQSNSVCNIKEFNCITFQ